MKTEIVLFSLALSGLCREFVLLVLEILGSVGLEVDHFHRDTQKESLGMIFGSTDNLHGPKEMMTKIKENLE